MHNKYAPPAPNNGGAGIEGPLLFWFPRIGARRLFFQLPHYWGLGGFLALALLSGPACAGKLPPPTTPASQRKPTPTPAKAKSQVQAVHQILPSAFYNSPAFPERYRPYVSLLAKDEYEQEQGYKFNKIIRGDIRKQRIALTFDDGPHPVYTLQLLSILRRTHTPATFFVVGKQVEKHPALVQLEVAEGHEVGNHTFDHVNLTMIPPELIGYELDACDAAIKKSTGSSVRFFRPPGGDYDGDVIREAAKRGYITTLWTVDPGDFSKPPADVILKRTLDHLENGAIILLHDGIPQTMQVLPALIQEARKRGYEFVTVSQLARDY